MSHAQQGVGVVKERQPPTGGPRGRGSSGRAWGSRSGQPQCGKGSKGRGRDASAVLGAGRGTQNRSGSEDGTGTRVRLWEQGPQMISQHLMCLMAPW